MQTFETFFYLWKAYRGDKLLGIGVSTVNHESIEPCHSYKDLNGLIDKWNNSASLPNLSNIKWSYEALKHKAQLNNNL